MTVDPANLGFRILPADLPSAAAGSTGAASATDSVSFGESLRQATSGVENLNLDAAYKASSLLDGSGADVHDTMIAVEKADLSFQLMLQVRNKVVQAYQQIASMQF